jgi:hypothetical protein
MIQNATGDLAAHDGRRRYALIIMSTDRCLYANLLLALCKPPSAPSASFSTATTHSPPTPAQGHPLTRTIHSFALQVSAAASINIAATATDHLLPHHQLGLTMTVPVALRRQLSADDASNTSTPTTPTTSNTSWL